LLTPPLDHCLKPEYIAQLKHTVEGHHIPPVPEWNTKEANVHWRGDDIELCRNCHWHAAFEATGYSSRVRVEYIRRNRALWAVGKDWLFWDEPNNNTLPKDYISQKFLHGTSVPLVESHRYTAPDTTFHFTVVARAKGQQLRKLIHTFTDEVRQTSLVSKLSLLVELSLALRHF